MIEHFRDEYRFLSNFWPCRVLWDGYEYLSVEHAYQAAKTTDPVERAQIRMAPRAGQAKSYGRRLKFMRPDWDSARVGVMLGLLRQKFKDPELAKKLDDTGDIALVEGNYWGDTFWGVCNGKGENQLGKLLMQVREENRKV